MQRVSSFPCFQTRVIGTAPHIPNCCPGRFCLKFSQRLRTLLDMGWKPREFMEMICQLCYVKRYIRYARYLSVQFSWSGARKCQGRGEVFSIQNERLHFLIITMLLMKLFVSARNFFRSVRAMWKPMLDFDIGPNAMRSEHEML
jgi:hypothetical protein